VVDAFTESIDVLPTLLDRCGIDHPAHVDGASLVPFLDGEATPPGWREEVRWEWDFRDPRRARAEELLGLRMDECSLAVVRDRDGKYVHFGGHERGLPPLFFDLAEDPGELVDRAREPARQADLLDYAQRMVTWRLTHADSTLTGMLAHPKGFVTRRDPPRPAIRASAAAPEAARIR
jgi:arylsulfatase A-like enzyme